MKINQNFLGGRGGAKQKTLCGGEDQYFLELHIYQKAMLTEGSSGGELGKGGEVSRSVYSS